jgi:hypothetical protein
VHAQLNETLAATAARVVLRPQTVIGFVHEKVAGGRIVDELSNAFLAEGLLGDIRSLRHSEAAAMAYAIP